MVNISVNGESGQLTTNQRGHSDLVTDLVTVILAISEGLGKVAVEILKYAYDRSSQLSDIIWFAISLLAISLSWSAVLDPVNGTQHSFYRSCGHVKAK